MILFDFPILQKKPKLTSYVVACGHQYGKGENLFHFFFKVDVNVSGDNIYTECVIWNSIFCKTSFSLLFFKGVLVDAVFKSSCLWRGNKLHSHDSCIRPWKVIIDHITVLPHIRYTPFEAITAELNCFLSSVCLKTSLSSSPSQSTLLLLISPTPP